jgi:putative ATPase
VASLFAQARSEPLAARLRPRTLAEFIGQPHLLGPGAPLRVAIDRGRIDSMILWGPPGVGKTTLARLLASAADAEFVAFSAVTDGVARVREIVAEAARRRDLGRATLLFADEIHRFNRAQQDAFLPHVESGVIVLVGATTENPSVALTGALLSRARVLVLEPLVLDDLAVLARRALTDRERGLGGRALALDEEGLAELVALADGDGRRLLGVLEAAAALVADGVTITGPVIVQAAQRRVPRHDRSGESHYNLASALHKALRGSDPQGALYWLARMVAAGEDPRFIGRRLVRMATEDVGLADPQALSVALAAAEAFERLGSPEGELALAEAVVYLATAPKSNRVHVAWEAALVAARETPAAPVPLHLRNAPTRLLAELGYGAGYQYAFDADDAYLPQDYLPVEVAGRDFYEPGRFGFERDIARRLAWWRSLRDRSRERPPHPSGTPPDAPADPS